MPIQAFQSQTFPSGLHLARCKIPNVNGFYEADPNATFRQGQVVNLNASSLIIKNTSGLTVFGIAKWTKDVGNGNAVQVDEQVVLPGTTTVNLKRSEERRVGKECRSR